MGVPALFRWLSQKYPKIVSSVVEEKPQVIDGLEIPINTTGPNPNNQEMDNLYLDMNGIVHPCSHPDDRPAPETEAEMMLEIFKYTDRLIKMVRPRKLLMIAVDGVAPRAKMNQQRSRRFRSAQEAKEKEAEAAEFVKLLVQGGKDIHESLQNKKVWDSNAITPGTPFMDVLAASIRYWVVYKLNTDPAWAMLKVIVSDSSVPGEGEHKIMEFIRSQRSSPEYDPNTRHVIYGLDADLIMLGLGTHEPHFLVLREDVFFQESKSRACKLCGQTGHKVQECTGQPKERADDHDTRCKGTTLKPFIWLHVSILREYLAAELNVPGCPFRFDLERAIDDWIFMCFFVGNDFLPHLPSLDIRDGAIDTLNAIWRDNLPNMGGYVTKDGVVNLERARYILDGLAKQEDAIFKRRREAEQRRDDNAKRRKIENNARINSQVIHRRESATDGKTSTLSFLKEADTMLSAPFLGIVVSQPGETSTENTNRTNYQPTHDRGPSCQANLANKSAATAIKSQLLSSQPSTLLKDGEDKHDEYNTKSVTCFSKSSPDSLSIPTGVPQKRKANDITINTPTLPVPNETKGAEGEPNLDTVRLWEPGYRDRYYEQKFGKGPNDLAFRQKVAADYVEGLCWVLLYYFQGCPSWTWFYPHHYAPFAADFEDLNSLEMKFIKGKPFKPFEQLMGVLPAASKHNLPLPFQELMTNPNSEIIDFYPEDFPIDLNGKKFAWQGVVLLPFIEEKRLLDAIAKLYPKLSAVDHARNGVGKESLHMSDQHPLYNDLATRFYSKRGDTYECQLRSKVSEGLAGVVTKDDKFIPRSTVPFPLHGGRLPDIDDNRALNVFYSLPPTKNAHKSMLLRGVRLPPPFLNHIELDIIRSKATNSGRSFGGAQFSRGNNSGRDRGRYGSDSYHPPDFSYQSNRAPMPHVGISPTPVLRGYNQWSQPGTSWAPPTPIPPPVIGRGGWAYAQPPPPTTSSWTTYPKGVAGNHGHVGYPLPHAPHPSSPPPPLPPYHRDAYDRRDVRDREREYDDRDRSRDRDRDRDYQDRDHRDRDHRDRDHRDWGHQNRDQRDNRSHISRGTYRVNRKPL